jgi:tetratricopeptide (TPR) repeat protein
LNRLDKALAVFGQARRLDEGRAAMSPANLDVQAHLSYDLDECGKVESKLGRYRQAIADFERALAIQARLAAADPNDVMFQLESAKLLNGAAPAYEAIGNRAKAIAVLTTAAARLEAALASDPDNHDTRLHVGLVRFNLGDVFTRAAGQGGQRAQADWADARSNYQRALDTLEKLRGHGRPDLSVDPGRMIAGAERGLALCRQHLRPPLEP